MAIITISRGTFSGGEELAARLGAALGYRVVSREVLVDAAARYGVSEAALARAMETGPGIWDRFLHDRVLYLAFVQEALCEKVQGDRVVYHGHAGHLLLRGVRHVLRVRLIAPLEVRVAQVMRKEALDRPAARKFVERVDRDRERWTRLLYGLDWHDPSLYDLVVNLENVDMEGACAAVAALLARPRFQPDEESRRAFADLHLGSRVRAALAADPATAHAEVEVRASGDAVEVEGKLTDPRLVDLVVARARAVQGVGEVRYGTRVMLRGPGG